jgi:riboflavin kinase/FMN adenylyltransferase
MKIYTGAEGLRGVPPTAIALGKFDGVHLGHAELIRRAVARARAGGLAAAVFTFSNHPRNVIEGRAVVRGLATEAEKERLLRELGVDYVFSLEFDEAFHSMAPADFIGGLLLGAFNARAVFCGFNFRFGADKAGGPELLREAAERDGFELTVMEPYLLDGALVSSTEIRRLVEAGDVAAAAAMLGRPFSMSGTVTRGNGIGRSLGFPTANIEIPDGLTVPAYGVYVTDSGYCGGEREGLAGGAAGCDAERGGLVRSVTNVGVRPTVGDNRLLAETHIFGIPDDDLYGGRLRVEFLSMLRPEMRFGGMDELMERVEVDKRDAMAYGHA